MIGKRILLVDDDKDFLELAGRFFQKVGAQVITAQDGMEGISKVFTHRPNLVILDVIMPGEDGFQICKNIRQFTNTPLIMISSLDQDQLLVKGLEAGADDFLPKPCNLDILLARARAVLRRSEHSDDYQAVLDFNDGYLKINVEKHRVRINSKQVKLTPIEFRLLLYLVEHADKVLPYRQILENVWGNEYTGNDDFVHVYISHLRRKIEQDSKNPRYILSVYGIGYIFEKQKS